MSFWLNNSVSVNNSKSKLISQILSNEELLLKVNKQLFLSKIKLDYNIHKTITNTFVKFINNNYINPNDTLKLMYTEDLLEFYKDSLIITFHPKGKTEIIGFIIGKKCRIYIDTKIIESLEVNLLCIIPKLRNLNLAPYMINIVGKESILQYNVGISHYTISNNIKSPHFGIKEYKHIPINIDKLVTCGFFPEFTNVDSYKNAFNNTFNNTFNKLYIKYNNINQNEISLLYNKLIEYNKKIYTIYECISLEQYNLIVKNKSFHHFVLYNNKDEIVSYMCFFNLDTLNILNNTSYRNGNIFLMAFNNPKNISNTLEYICQYIFNNNIFDLVSFTDIFSKNQLIKCISGTGSLKYYLFNTSCNLIDNNKNGLITI